MRRKLTKAEVFYIQNNTSRPIDELVNDLGGNISKKSVENVLSETVVKTEPVPPENPSPAQLEMDDKGRSVLGGKTEEEQKEIIQNNDFKTGNLFARQPGVVIMTEAASELADERRKMQDARDILRLKKDPNFTENNRDKIHVIKKSS